jgi:hypothetical protein
MEEVGRQFFEIESEIGKRVKVCSGDTKQRGS